MRKGYFFGLFIVADVILIAVMISQPTVPAITGSMAAPHVQESDPLAQERASSATIIMHLGPEHHDRPWGEIQNLMFQQVPHNTIYRPLPRGDFWRPGELEELLQHEQKILPNKRMNADQ